MGIECCKIMEFKKISDTRGNLTPIEGTMDLPFSIKRAYYLYDVPSGSSRAGHAHKQLEQVLIAISGSLDIIVNDGKYEQRFHLNQPNFGLYMPKLIWRELENFSSNAVCLVLASQHYDESDYYRDYDSFHQDLFKKNCI